MLVGNNVCPLCKTRHPVTFDCTSQTMQGLRIPPPNTMGWQCPRCGNCYAPHVPSCFKCNKESHDV